MSSCPDFIFLTLLILLGSPTIQAKRTFPRSEVDCIDFANKELKYHLPANIFPWDELNQLVPCCVDNQEALPGGCTECSESVIWKFNSNDHGPTICAKIPVIAGDADNLEVLFDNKQDRRENESFIDTRRLIQAGFGPGTRSRDPNYMSSGQTESSGGKQSRRKSLRYSGRELQGRYEEGNSHGLRSENSRQIDREPVPPVYNPESYQPYPRMFTSEEETVDNGFLERIFSHLFPSDQAVIPPVNATIESPNQIKQSIVPLDCTIPVQEINPVPSDWYSERDAPDVMMQRRANDKGGAKSSILWNEDNAGYPEVPSPNINAENVGNDDQEKKFNMNININKMSNRRNQ